MRLGEEIDEGMLEEERLEVEGRGDDVSEFRDEVQKSAIEALKERFIFSKRELEPEEFEELRGYLSVGDLAGVIGLLNGLRSPISGIDYALAHSETIRDSEFFLSHLAAFNMLRSKGAAPGWCLLVNDYCLTTDWDVLDREALANVVRQLPRLRSLAFPNMKKIKTLDGIEVFGGLEDEGLKRLGLRECSELTTLKGVEGFCLKNLDITGCTSLKSLDPLEGMVSLEEICMRGISLSPRGLLKMKSLTGLKKVVFGGLKSATALENAHKLEDLEILSLETNDLTCLRDKRNLRHVFIIGGKNCAFDFSWLAGESLESVYLEHMSAVHGLDRMSDSPNLWDLYIVNCEGVSLKGLNRLQGLRGFCISYSNIEDGLEEIADLEGLKDLHIDAFRGENLDFVGYKPNIKSFMINDSTVVATEGVEGMINLEELCVLRCGELSKLSHLSGLGSLAKLQLSSCSSLINIDEGELTCLRTLLIQQCENLVGLGGVRKAPLEKVYLSECSRLQDLQGLNVSALVEIGLMRCFSLQSVDFLSKADKLESVEIVFCDGIRDFEPLYGLPSLRNVKLNFMWSGVLAEEDILELRKNLPESCVLSVNEVIYGG